MVLARRAHTMEFRILGPLEVLEDGRALDVGTGKQRAVLAVLLLHPGEVVSRDRLIDVLWDESAPPSAPNSVHVYVSRLRKVLGNGQLETHGHGYRLVHDSEQLDLARFERLLGEGRERLAAGDPERSAERLRAALSLWRGPPLSDLAAEPFAQTEIARLEELHLAALEELVEADLALGRHAELIPELEALVRRNPLRERLRGQLMLALYGSGRQAEALETYQQGRRILSEELGLEPGRQLQELERSILRQDMRLEPRRRASGSGGRTHRRHGVLIAVGAGLLLAAVAAVVGIELVREESPGLSAASANAVAAIDAGSLRLIADVPVGGGPSSVAADDSGVWVVNALDDTVSRLDPRTGAVNDRVDVGRDPGGIAVGGGTVWVANSLDATVSRIDSRTNRVAEPISVGLTPLAVAVDGTTVWVTNSGDRSVTRINGATGGVVKTILTGAFGRGIAVGGGGIWITDETSGRVAVLDPRRARVVRTIGVGNGPTAIAFGHGATWVANSLDGTVSRIDADSGRVTATISVGEGPRGIAIGPDAVWISSEFTEELVRVDPRENAVVERIPIGNRPQGLAVGRGEVWFGVQDSGRTHRGGRLVAAGGGQIQGSIDPSYASWFGTFGSLSPAYDGLVGLARRGGSDGTQLMPNLAESLPVVTGGGTRYAYRLRHGIRYSNGSPVRASDFSRAIQRAYHSQNPPPVDLMGAAACIQRPRSCDISRGIRTDDASRTIVFRLRRPDDGFLRFLTQLWPVPRGVPIGDTGSGRLRVAAPGAASNGAARPVPSTGPYMIERYVPGRLLVLVRNPFFRVWSSAVRPDGLPDAIELRIGALNEPVVKVVERGGADLAGVPLDEPDEVAAFDGFRGRFPARVHEQAVRATVLLFLNTTKPPFDDVRVRRAVNYTVDRAAIAASYASRVTCQLRPPGTVGFRRYCPYTASPHPAGEWRAPDFGRARRLVADSGTRGMSVDVWTYGQSPGFWEELAQGSARALESLGYQVRIRRAKDLDAYIEQVSNADTRGVQAGVIGWYGPPPKASSLLDLFVCGEPKNFSFFCDRRTDARIHRAFELEATDPERAAALWEGLERDLVDLAPWVPVFTPSHASVVSARLGNYQRNSETGTLLDQLWVR